MRLPILIAGLALLAACSEEPSAEREAVELPEPSGPPVVQQVQEEARPAASPAPAASASAPELRVSQGGTLLMRLSCPAGQLTLQVPGFTPIGSEDRLTLGIGEEAVTLAADLERPGGVTGAAPAPDNLAALAARARTLSAVYGAQQAGPVPAPPPARWQALLAACRS